jgi:hypothetical protein
MQDRPAEAEGGVMLGSTAAQDSQPERQSSTTVQHIPLERVHSEERIQIGFQPNMVPGTEQPTQHPPVTALVFNNPILSDEPLKNELERLMHCSRVLHEHKVCFFILSVICFYCELSVLVVSYFISSLAAPLFLNRNHNF